MTSKPIKIKNISNTIEMPPLKRYRIIELDYNSMKNNKKYNRIIREYNVLDEMIFILEL